MPFGQIVDRIPVGARVPPGCFAREFEASEKARFRIFH
jgi:hypothetical protein